MDIADIIIGKLFSWLKRQKKFVNTVNNLATELEEHRDNVNISKVVGSTTAALGGVVTVVAGFLTLATVGLATPLAIGAGIATGLGAATSVGSEIVEAFISGSTMKEAEEIGQQSTGLAEEIQRLIGLLEKELEKKKQNSQTSAGMNEENNTMTELLKSLARKWGLPWHDNFKFLIPGSSISKIPMFTEGKVDRILSAATLSAPVLSNLVLKIPAKAIAQRAAAKGIARLGGGAIGLAIALPEVINSWKDLVKNNKVTEASQSLRETAKGMKTTCEAVKTELKEIRKLLKRLAKVNNCIGHLDENCADLKMRRELIEFAKDHCQDETTWKWLKDNSDTFLKLVKMFRLVKKHIDKEEEKDHSREVDITFVAHGCISNSMIPASCLMPLPTITDVVLYTPWNCEMSADAAYGVATGRTQPHHRVFICSGNDCEIPSSGHQPKNLPINWNSMKKAGTQTIPNIMLYPLGPKDGAWKRIQDLEIEIGAAGKNRIVLPYILPGSKDNPGVPFYVVTLALSLVLMFSRFRATVHLTACLGKCSKREMFDEAQLQRQYSYTMDNTAMVPSKDMLLCSPYSQLYTAFKALFG